jgi:hypothetical protein
MKSRAYYAFKKKKQVLLALSSFVRYKIFAGAGSMI